MMPAACFAKRLLPSARASLVCRIQMKFWMRAAFVAAKVNASGVMASRSPASCLIDAAFAEALELAPNSFLMED
jgi:hypothetical protein